MRYIRTKDEIGILVETNKDIRDKDNYWIKKGCYFKTWFSPNVNREDIIKQADTIKDLCDGLIVEDKDNTNNWFVMEISEFESKDNVDKKYMVDRWNFNAFIKTDKGLIYVAKMNDKGELELL